MKSEKHDNETSWLAAEDVSPADMRAGVDRRAFMMRSAVIGAATVIAGCSSSAPEPERAPATSAAPPAAPPQPAQPAVQLSPELDVVKKSKGPVMTVLDEFYKVGPGPSSSHTIGPMRITHDFYQRCTKLPPDQLAKATGLKVHLFGSLSDRQRARHRTSGAGRNHRQGAGDCRTRIPR
jgi:L-serine dehydratase